MNQTYLLDKIIVFSCKTVYKYNCIWVLLFYWCYQIKFISRIWKLFVYISCNNNLGKNKLHNRIIVGCWTVLIWICIQYLYIFRYNIIPEQSWLIFKKYNGIEYLLLSTKIVIISLNFLTSRVKLFFSNN